MIKSIREFLGLCNHELETVRSGHILDWNNDVVGYYYDCRCKKCGELKRFNLKV